MIMFKGKTTKLLITTHCSSEFGIKFIQAHPMYERICLTKRWAVSIQHSWDEAGCSFRFAAKPTRKQIAWARKQYMEDLVE